MGTDSHVKPGRAKQRERTRRLILGAASSLMDQGLVPTVEQAAEAAEVSVATGYRYFPSQGALLQAAVEASFSHLPENLFTGLDVMQRIDRLIDVAFPNIVEHELLDRAVLRLALDQWLKKKSGHALKEDEVQRHGRKPLVEQILEPLVGRVRRAQLERLRQGLGMILGMETFVALRDIYDLEPKQIGEVWRWACKALVENTLVEAEEARPGIAASSSSEV